MSLKTMTAAVMVGAAALAAAPVRAAQASALGVGVALGEPIGGSLKVWLDDRFAFDAGVGFSDGNGAFWGDALWHDWTLLPQPKDGRLAGYLALGGQVRTGDTARFGVRTLAGLSWRPSGHPLELFAEAGPLFRMTDGSGTVDGVGGIGLRVMVGGSAKR